MKASKASSIFAANLSMGPEMIISREEELICLTLLSTQLTGEIVVDVPSSLHSSVVAQKLVGLNLFVRAAIWQIE